MARSPDQWYFGWGYCCSVVQHVIIHSLLLDRKFVIQFKLKNWALPIPFWRFTESVWIEKSSYFGFWSKLQEQNLIEFTHRGFPGEVKDNPVNYQTHTFTEWVMPWFPIPKSYCLETINFQSVLCFLGDVLVGIKSCGLDSKAFNEKVIWIPFEAVSQQYVGK